MPVGKDAAGIVNKGSCTIQYSWLFLDVGKITCKVDEITFIVKAWEIEMFSIEKRDIIIVLIADENYSRFLIIENLLWIFFTACQDE